MWPPARTTSTVLTQQGHLGLRADPFAFATEVPPSTASVVYDASYTWRDAGWLADREAVDAMTSPMSVYEVHVASWRQVEDGHGGWRPLTYRELADALPAYVSDLGFTHVGCCPVAEHPFGGSWGYQVTGYYAPTARFGSPDDFRYLVDRLHQAGIGVIVDWVVAHFPKDDWALARFDGTALYEHIDPRLSEHPDWGPWSSTTAGTRCETSCSRTRCTGSRNTTSTGCGWTRWPRCSTSTTRSHDQWVPNRFGGKENLEAIDFIKETNEVVYRHHPSVLLIAEESTSWPAAVPADAIGGLGFGFKWNMGWMNDSWSISPRSRCTSLPPPRPDLQPAVRIPRELHPAAQPRRGLARQGLARRQDAQRQVAAARQPALLAWMWAHPGSGLLFMGGEIAQTAEWRSDGSIDWHLLQYPEHAGTQALVRRLNHDLPRRTGPVGARLRLDRLPLDRRRRQRRACCRSCASRRRAPVGRSPASPT